MSDDSASTSVGRSPADVEDQSADVEVVEQMLDMTELVYRQVPSGHYRLGRLSSQAFSPMPKDHGQLSCDRSSLASAKQAFHNFVSRGWASIGSWAVSVRECGERDLPCFWNPNPKQSDGTRLNNEAHTLIDFRKLKSASQVKRIATQLSALMDVDVSTQVRYKS